MSGCEIKGMTGKPCNTQNAKGCSLVLGIKIAELAGFVFQSGSTKKFDRINLVEGAKFKDLTAKKRKASALGTLEGDDPEEMTWTNTVNVASSYLTAEKIEALESYVGKEIGFFVKDNNKKYWFIGDLDKGIYINSAEFGTGSEDDGENGLKGTFVGKNFGHGWYEFVGDFDTEIKPLIETATVVPPPVPPTTP